MHYYDGHLTKYELDEREAVAHRGYGRLIEIVSAIESSGLNVAAALQIAQEVGPGHTVVTVAVDSGLKYLAGDLYKD